MAKFTALPVTKGDAFLLERSERVVLVDGGQHSKCLLDALTASIPNRRIDVLVCTHSDADHVGGLRSIFSSSHCPHELWIPEIWGHRLIDLMFEPREFFVELAQNVLSQNQLISAANPPLIRVTHERPRFQEEVRRPLDLSFEERIAERLVDGGGSQEVVQSRFIYTKELENLLVGAAGFPDQPRDPQMKAYEEHIKGQSIEIGQAFLRFTMVANRIHDLIKDAASCGVRIRWFRILSEEELAQGPMGGDPGFLEPMNSREEAWVRVAHSGNLSALEYLSLSIVNRNSLVFIAPETQAELAVLFSGDGLLESLPTAQCPSSDVLVTAPHHGSQANAPAYQNVTTWLATRGGNQTVFWVRSDDTSTSRPGQAFKASRGCRYCTQCGQLPKPLAGVCMTCSSGQQNAGQQNTWSTSTQTCSC